VSKVDTASPDVKEWCGRLQLALDPLFVDPVTGYAPGGPSVLPSRNFNNAVRGPLACLPA
jgi:hypothetical protein